MTDAIVVKYAQLPILRITLNGNRDELLVHFRESSVPATRACVQNKKQAMQQMANGAGADVSIDVRGDLVVKGALQETWQDWLVAGHLMGTHTNHSLLRLEGTLNGQAIEAHDTLLFNGRNIEVKRAEM